MIYEISTEVAAYIAAQGCPVPVVYGNTRGSVLTDQRIEISRGYGFPDRIEAASGHRPANPTIRSIRSLAALVRIYAKSSSDGARIEDHERQAESIADQVQVAIASVVTQRKNSYRFTSAGFLDDGQKEAEGITQWPGVIYEMRFEVDRGVYRTTWAGEGLAEETIGAVDGPVITRTINVS